MTPLYPCTHSQEAVSSQYSTTVVLLHSRPMPCNMIPHYLPKRMELFTQRHTASCHMPFGVNLRQHRCESLE